MKKLEFLLATILLFFLSNCASFNCGSNPIRISSEPSDAYVYIDGWILKTPADVPINNSIKKQIFLIKKDGYPEQEFQINKSIRYIPVFLGNLFWTIGYPYAIYSDFSSGCAYNYQDTQVILKKE